jgi:hypothetical protein
MRALCILPLRPGALAALTPCDFDSGTRALTIGKDKQGRPRLIVVPKSIPTNMRPPSAIRFRFTSCSVLPILWELLGMIR